MSEEIKQRKIIHVDMDAFYASVEQMDNPELRGKPLAVGGSEVRGVVSAASYEARKFGVRSAMSGVQAKRNCPELIFVRPRFDRYKEISNKIRKIFLDYTDLVEPLSLDEAYLDVTQNKKGNPISLSIIYMLVAQRLNIPVYGINLPRHFIMAYVEDEETENLEGFSDKQIISSEAQGEIKFYINAYNGGGVFNQEQLLGILKEMELEEKPEYMQPCSNADIVLRVLMNLYNSYSVAKKPEAEFIDRVVQKFRD